jgi:hypothetical protein
MTSARFRGLRQSFLREGIQRRGAATKPKNLFSRLTSYYVSLRCFSAGNSPRTLVR